MLPAEVGAGSDLLACRVCLDAGGRLLPISGSGFEDIFGVLTGVQLSMEGFPRHLCAFCRATLSKCISFRDSCERSSALLQTLMEKGPLTMKDIETIDRKTNKLTNGMKREKIFHFLTHPYLQIPPIKREDNDVTPYEEIPNTADELYLELDHNFIINNPKIYKNNDPQMIIKKVKLEKENSMASSESEDGGVDASENQTNYAVVEIDITEEELCQSDVNTKNDGETDLIKKTKSIPIQLDSEISTKTTKSRAGNTKFSFKSKKRKKMGDDVYPLFDYEAFEEEFNVKIKLLSIDEQKQEIEEKKKANKSVFCCEMCGKGCNTEKTMKNHLSCHDPNTGPFECEICRCRFRTGAEVRLQRHRDTHRLSFACRDCGFISRDKSNAKLHSLVHSGKTYTCQHCGQTYKHRTSYLTHVRERHPARNVACPQCGETFLSENGVRQHRAKAHGSVSDSKPKSDIKCPVCDATFLSREALVKHTAGAGVPHAALWPCAACGDSCGSDTALKHHTAEKHSPEQQYCDEFHVRAHTGERPYQCAECPLACALKGTLARHIARFPSRYT
ncbi:uncharacterized protein isoform X2 [Choristoneura fumiferana]|uniref:uncharacterized protein isoform X2 n=1 Tax=Choristoneura fumiferana TaxID=7141 RepID=UPI003D15C991